MKSCNMTGNQQARRRLMRFPLQSVVQHDDEADAALSSRWQPLLWSAVESEESLFPRDCRRPAVAVAQSLL